MLNRLEYYMNDISSLDRNKPVLFFPPIAVKIDIANQLENKLVISSPAFGGGRK